MPPRAQMATQQLVSWRVNTLKKKEVYGRKKAKKLIIDINCHNCYLEHTIFVNVTIDSMRRMIVARMRSFAWGFVVICWGLSVMLLLPSFTGLLCAERHHFELCLHETMHLMIVPRANGRLGQDYVRSHDYNTNKWKQRRINTAGVTWRALRIFKILYRILNWILIHRSINTSYTK